MDALTQYFVIPEVLYSLMAILGLLLVWQYHQKQVLAGRIYAIDFWDVTGIRMFLHATTWDGRSCAICREANGTVFLPSLATKKNFSTLAHPCTNALGCRCLIVGLYGGWPEAAQLLERLRRQGRKTPLKLTDKELLALFDGPWHQSITSAGDRLTINMLEGMRVERKDPEGSAVRYRYVIDQAKGARDVRLVAPAFMRLAEVLEHLGRHEEAVEVIESFERRFPRNKRAFYFPSDAQRRVMATRKLRLQANLKRSTVWSQSRQATQAQADRFTIRK